MLSLSIVDELSISYRQIWLDIEVHNYVHTYEYTVVTAIIIIYVVTYIAIICIVY